MDIVFDIDGTLANAEHRLHYIKDPNYWVGIPPSPDWDSFLSDEQVAGDSPIMSTWEVLKSLVYSGNRVIFITGRPEEQMNMTWHWLTDPDCYVRMFMNDVPAVLVPRMYMRTNGDRRPSHVIKRELLQIARQDGFDPVLVFEDRKDDTAMWREEGLLCCQVAEGNY